MKKLSILVLACLAVNSFAYEGYLNSHNDTIVRDSSNNCVHTGHFDLEKDGIAKCGEGKIEKKVELKEKEVVVTDKVHETVEISDADHVLFKFDVATLSKEGVSVLTDFISKIGKNDDIVKITIEGFTDNIGLASYNLKLSQKRANAVKNFLIKNGYDSEKIVAQGRGAANAKDCSGEHKYNIYTIASLKKRLAKAKSAKIKKSLRAKIAQQMQARSQAVMCGASDRKVVFTIDRNSKVEKEVKKVITVPAN